MPDDWEKRMRQRMQEKTDEFDKERKYVKNNKGKWSLKPSYISHNLDKVTGPEKSKRKKELKAKAREFALRQSSRSKDK